MQEASENQEWVDHCGYSTAMRVGISIQEKLERGHQQELTRTLVEETLESADLAALF